MRIHCESVSKVIIPAVRCAVAQELNERYGMRQYQIAKCLDVAQASISKYLNNKRSGKLNTLRKRIIRMRTTRNIAKMAASGATPRSISEALDKLAAECARTL